MTTTHLVLVDDDELDRLTVRRLLIDEPEVALKEFESGEAAVAALASTRCDCLLLDYHMPGITGLEVLEQLKERNLEVPTIILTGAGDEELAVVSMRSGALDYLPKSRLERDTLLSKIRAVRLLHEARQRTIVAEAELHETIGHLRRAVAARESVLGVVSHDLRGPLNNVNLALGLLEGDDPAQRELAIATIRRAIDRADRLISELLDVARISGHGLELDRREVPIRELVDAAVADVRPSATSKQIRVVVRNGEAAGTVHGDRSRLIQVLDNLLRNAIKYGADAGTIVVDTIDRGAAVEFAVSDDGPGIEGSSEEAVFDQFWQAKDQGSAGGYGLGLAIAKGVVTAHGGTIGVGRSEAGGARFYFTIPRPEGAGEA